MPLAPALTVRLTPQHSHALFQLRRQPVAGSPRRTRLAARAAKKQDEDVVSYGAGWYDATRRLGKRKSESATLGALALRSPCAALAERALFVSRSRVSRRQREGTCLRSA